MASSNSIPVGTMTCGPNQPIESAQCSTRKVSFVFYCAPRDDGNHNPMYTDLYGKDKERTGVTDSASYLSRLPYVVVDADTKKIIFPFVNSKGKLPEFNPPSTLNAWHDGVRNVHILPPINIPNNVSRIALHIASDATPKHQKFQLFPWTVPAVAHSKVHIFEIRTDLQDKFSLENKFGNTPKENTIMARPGCENEYFGYLNGDLWLSLSHEFTNDEIKKLCPAESLSRAVPEVASVSKSQSNIKSQSSVKHQDSIKPQDHGKLQSTDKSQPTEIDWAITLQAIYGLGENSRSLDAFSVKIPTLDITLKFAPRAFANAINTSARTTVQQALRRTSPRAFAAILKAAWRLNIDTVHLSSSWRPMLGSKLHKMGLGLDVTEIVDSAENIDFAIRNHGKEDRKSSFPTTPAGKKMARLYDELTANQLMNKSAIYTPWINWVEPHDTHMHITAKED